LYVVETFELVVNVGFNGNCDRRGFSLSNVCFGKGLYDQLLTYKTEDIGMFYVALFVRIMLSVPLLLLD
jgi:hypothetical protein